MSGDTPAARASNTWRAPGAGGFEVAVGDQSTSARQAELAAVGVPGEGEVVAVAGELVEHPQVRRMCHGDPEVGVGVGRTSDGGEVVVLQVRVVDPGEVARVERIPVADLVNPANRFMVKGPSGYVGPAFEVAGLFVWGFTAQLVSVLLDAADLTEPWDEGRRRRLPWRYVKPYLTQGVRRSTTRSARR